MCYKATGSGVKLIISASDLLDRHQPVMAERTLQAALLHLQQNPHWMTVRTTDGSTLGERYKEIYDRVQAMIAGKISEGG